MIRSSWRVAFVLFLAGCGGFASNNNEEPFSLIAPSHTNSTTVQISGVYR